MIVRKGYELLENVRDVLAESADIKAWSNSNYGRDHCVFLGINNEQPPDPDTKFPLLVLYSCTRAKSANVADVNYGIELGAGVKDESITVEGNKTTYDGLSKVCEFRELAEAVLTEGKNGLGKVDVNSDTWDDMQFPLFASNSIIEISRPKNYRSSAR